MGMCEKWTIAYRKRVPEKTLLDDLASPFTKLPNTWRYWRADPFLIEHEGKSYLFAELYDRLARRGVLGCCELTDSGTKKWKIVINEPFHLSYPFVFLHDGTYYMIPESFRAQCLILYRAVEFPYKWEKVRKITMMTAVDSTIIDAPSGRFMLTARVENGDGELVLMSVDDRLELSAPMVVSEKNDPNTRPAGNAFYRDGQLIRPSQDCSVGYGDALNFMNITRIHSGGFAETLIRKVSPSDIHISGVHAPKGIHTYNLSERYEVIDYKEYELGLVSKIASLIARIKRRVE